MADFFALVALSFLTSPLKHETSYYNIDSLSGRITVYGNGQAPRIEEVRFEKAKNVDLSPAEIAALARINFLTARCRISTESYLQECQVLEASTDKKESKAAYNKIMENLKVADCGKTLCKQAIVTVYIRFSVPTATGVSTKTCIPPFCSATPPPPRAPANPR